MRKSHFSSNHYFQLSLISVALFGAYQTAIAEESLEQINITEEAGTNTTAGSKGYTIKAMNTATGLKIAGKDTPQSVSVITKKQLDDKAIHTLEDAMKNTTGINVVRDSGLQTRFLSRGFYVDQIGEDGITTNIGGRSGYTAKIDVSPSTDLAIYDHIEVVRGATGLTQSNAEPGGTINLIRKRPTDKFQHLGEITVDHRGSARTMLDVSGGLNQDNSIRGRLVGVGEKSKSFKNNVHGKKGLIYGVTDVDLGNVGVLTLGGMYQKINEVPDFAGVMLPCENQDIRGYSVFEPACINPLTLPRDTYLGASWSRLKGDKYNLFSSTKFVFDNDWELNIEASYTKNDSDAKIGQFFSRNEHTFGISDGPSTAALLPPIGNSPSTIIPFDTPQEKVKEILASEQKRASDEYQQQVDKYRKEEFSQAAYEAARANDFFIFSEDDYIQKELAKRDIFDNSYVYSLYNYNSIKNNMNKREKFAKYTPNVLRHKKTDEQYGIKLDLNGKYTLFDRTHDFYVGYSYNNENIKSDYIDIFQRKYRVSTKADVGEVHQELAGRCVEDKNQNQISPLSQNIIEPDWGKYDDKGNRKIYVPECKNAQMTKYKPILDKNGNPVYIKKDNGELEIAQEPVYILDENGNKIPELDENGKPIIIQGNGAPRPLYKTEKIPDDQQYAAYNYAKYINKNKTHSVVVSTRFNATDALHLLLGMHYTHYKTTQSKEMPVRNGQPATQFQLAQNIQADKDHYTAKMSSHKFTPYAGITYDLTDEQSVYASYTKIFKQQDNVDVTNKTVLPPLIGTNYEIGWKGGFVENRLNASLALFKVEQKNRSVIDFGFVADKTLSGGGSFQTIARPIGRVVSKGFEFELAGNITENWQLFAGYTYNKSKYKNAEEINNERAKGAKDPYNFSNFTPVQMLRLATSYRIPNTKWTIGGGISAQSPTSSLYGIKQAGYTLFDANVQYEFNTHAKLSLIGTNLTDKTYFENNYNRTRGMNNFYGRPRTVMMKFDWQF